MFRFKFPGKLNHSITVKRKMTYIKNQIKIHILVLNNVFHCLAKVPCGFINYIH